MSFQAEGAGKVPPDQRLAMAVAGRMAQIHEVSERISAEIRGEPYVKKPPEVMRAAHLGEAALMLLGAEDPSRTISRREIVDEFYGVAGYANEAGRLSERTGMDIDAERARHMHITIAEQAQSGRSDERKSQDFARQLAASKELAQEQGVEVFAVYAEETLYYKAVKRAFIPIELAERNHSELDAHTEEKTSNFLDRAIAQAAPKEMLDALKARALSDPNWQARIDSFVETAKELIRQRFMYHFIKTYGYDELGKLPTVYNEGLRPRQPLTTVVAVLLPADPSVS